MPNREHFICNAVYPYILGLNTLLLTSTALSLIKIIQFLIQLEKPTLAKSEYGQSDETTKL